jgi:hypothetical protein
MLTHPRTHAIGRSDTTRPSDLPDDGYEDRAGVIHVHTTYSHDAHGKMEDVVRAANAQRLDYVIVTEHNTLQPLRDGWQGWHGATLLLIGMELSAKDGHYLAFNVTQEIDRERLTTQQVIDEVNRQGGLGFIAHPYFKKAPWRNWGVSGVTGIEGYNVAHDTLDEHWARIAFWIVATPAEPFYYSILDRPYDPLATWDALIKRQGRAVGIGSTDAHEIRVLGVKIPPYEHMFQLVRTHLLTAPGTLSAEQVYAALTQGHAYFSIELAAEARGFTWLAQREQTVLGVMGDEVLLEPDLRLSAWLPGVADLTLFKDGLPIDRTTAQRWSIPVTAPGAYRLEAARHGKPWIFSNPIYVTSAIERVDTPKH